MPGVYIHMEAAKIAADRLRAADLPAGFPVDAARAQEIGELCHTWRNYLALGSLGPDMFYLLPDFVDDRGITLRRAVQWTLDVWEFLDAEFIGKWEKWIDPVAANQQQLAGQLTGGLANQLAAVLDSLSAALISAFEGLLPRLGDWFGVLTSGAPRGFADNGFYWSDMFHYRRTYQFPYEMYRRARAARASATDDDERMDAEARMVFALGWMTHCATDVTGHPFTNAKSGGPFRDHWQRHHLVENHFDSSSYAARNPGPLYGEIGTSALHFRVAFVPRQDPPYNGRPDAPPYDYFAGFPPYDNGDGPTAAAARRAHFDLDSGELPEKLVEALLETMAVVHGDGPKILTQDPAFSATTEDPAGVFSPDGRPNEAALGEMWAIFYRYLKMMGSDGTSPRRPTPPPPFTDHSFPTPPGGTYGVDDDPSRGADVEDDSFTVLDLFLAIFAWIIYIGQVILWLVTVLPGLILDIATFPARAVVYWAVAVPAWNLFILARRALVMSAFLTPKPEEIDRGLVTLGTSTGFFSITAALDDPSGVAKPALNPNEPSGRASDTTSFGLDPAYPRNIVRDRPGDLSVVDLAGALGLTSRLQYAGDGLSVFKPTEWVAPWRYPLTNQSGAGVPQEGAATHVGPFVVGESATVLLPGAVGDGGARNRLEDCGSPEATSAALEELLPEDKHLGGPVDYSLYLLGRMDQAAAQDSGQYPVPDFNLDSDRGYAWRCWDWTRHGVDAEWRCQAAITPSPQSDFSYRQPCTPPQMFDARHDNPGKVVNGEPLDSQWYDPRFDLKVRYLLGRAPEPPPAPGEEPCGPVGTPHEPLTAVDWMPASGRTAAPDGSAVPGPASPAAGGPR
jgi:hypothetical protein